MISTERLFTADLKLKYTILLVSSLTFKTTFKISDTGKIYVSLCYELDTVTTF